MIKVDNIEVFNFEGAIRGCRNPYNSWDKSDSKWVEDWTAGQTKPGYKEYVIGDNDLDLMRRLYKAGVEHRTYARMIQVSMDITAPLYWWKEMDQYKVSTVTNSCSTMHKLHSKQITIDSFSFDKDLEDLVLFNGEEGYSDVGWMFKDLITYCEVLRQKYLETKDVKYWRALVQMLPSGWNQLRTWTGNYQNLQEIYKWRRNHKLQEWNDFCKIIKALPYAKELICYGVEDENIKEND